VARADAVLSAADHERRGVLGTLLVIEGGADGQLVPAR
jgi:hypothetical protein